MSLWIHFPYLIIQDEICFFLKQNNGDEYLRNINFSLENQVNCCYRFQFFSGFVLIYVKNQVYLTIDFKWCIMYNTNGFCLKKTKK